MLLLPGRGPSRVCWRSWSGSGDSATTGRTPDWLDFRRPGRPGTKTRHGVSWWTRQGFGSFCFRREKDHGAQRSGPRLWKRSFCASTQDRNKTVSCRCHLRLARAPASGQVRNLRRSRPGRWRPPTHGGRHGEAVKAPGNKSNGFARTPSVFFLFWERAAETRCSCCQGLLSVCWRSEGSVGNPARPRVVALRAGPRASASARRTSRAAQRQHGPVCGGRQSTISPFTCRCGQQS